MLRLKDKFKSFSYLETLMVLAFFGVVSASVLGLIGTSFFNSYRADEDLVANFLALYYLEKVKYKINENFLTSADWLNEINAFTTSYKNFNVSFEIQNRSSSSTELIVNVTSSFSSVQLKEEVYCWVPGKCF